MDHASAVPASTRSQVARQEALARSIVFHAAGLLELPLPPGATIRVLPPSSWHIPHPGIATHTPPTVLLRGATPQTALRWPVVVLHEALHLVDDHARKQRGLPFADHDQCLAILQQHYQRVAGWNECPYPATSWPFRHPDALEWSFGVAVEHLPTSCLFEEPKP